MGYGKTKSLRLVTRGGLLPLFLLLLAPLIGPSTASAQFGIRAFTVTARNANGTFDEQAGSHPFALDVHLEMNTDSGGEPEGAVRAFEIDLPPGLVGNALNVPRCPPAEFVANGLERAHCGVATQIGILRGTISGLGQISAPVYDLVPAPGYAAAFGVMVNGTPIVERLDTVGSGAATSIRLSGGLPLESRVIAIDEEIWGVPADPGHDSERACAGSGEGCGAGPERPLLTLPTSCSEPLLTRFVATSYGPAPETAAASSTSVDPGGNPKQLVGCDAVPFEPRLTLRASPALAPAALAMSLEVPQREGAEVTPAATLAALHLELPEGVALNPSSGSWLTGCSPSEIGLESPPGAEPPALDGSPATCPASSRLGSVEVSTPLADHELGGGIFLATPSDNPFGARYAFYLTIEDEVTGTIVKIPGRFDANPESGRLSAVVAELPRLPFGDLQIELPGGPRAPLANSGSCGMYEAEATFIPSTAPFGPPASGISSFTVASGAEGRPCPPSEAERNPAPSFQAGSEDARAGVGSTLAIHLAREDADQHLGSFDLTLPPGLIANLGSTPLGAAVGTVTAEAGIGPEPLKLGGTAYLEGPYKGAPYSLEAVVPAQAGPFDLGTIVERAAIEVDPVTAQVSVHADPLPQILEGVPLQLRGIRIDLDRPGFIRNPTSCEPMAITGTATTALGRSVPISDRFQVGDCAALSFKPKLSLALSGQVGRNGHPALRAMLSGNPDGAALAGAAFTLPAGELLDLRHLRGLCPQGSAPGLCPASSRLGAIRLQSPLLDGAIQGPVYLQVPSHRLPELTAEVSSGGLSFRLHGRTTSRDGRLGIRLSSLPDIPLSRAVLSLPGGRGGIVVNSRSLCTSRPTTTVSLSAHSGRTREFRARARVRGRC